MVTWPMNAPSLRICASISGVPTTRKRPGMSASELVAAHPAVHGNHRAGDVARKRRGEKAHQVRNVLGLAVLAERDLVLFLPLAALGGVVAQDLFALDAPRRDRVHRDAVAPQLARQALRPGAHRRLRGESAVQTLGLGLAGDVDDASPAALDHLRQQPVRELALAREVERHRLLPLRLARLEREPAAAAGVVDEDLHRAESL